MSLGKEESGDPVVLACAMPWECGRRADGISRALCVHGKVSKTSQSLLKEGVIYCFQFIVVNKFLILSFPISSETEDNREKLGRGPIGTKAFPLGWMKHLAQVPQGNGVRCDLLKGKDTYNSRAILLALAFKKIWMTSALFGTPIHTNVSTTHINIIYIYLWKCFQNYIFL